MRVARGAAFGADCSGDEPHDLRRGFGRADVIGADEHVALDRVVDGGQLTRRQVMEGGSYLRRREQLDSAVRMYSQQT